MRKVKAYQGSGTYNDSKFMVFIALKLVEDASGKNFRGLTPREVTDLTGLSYHYVPVLLHYQANRKRGYLLYEAGERNWQLDRWFFLSLKGKAYIRKIPEWKFNECIERLEAIQTARGGQ